MKRLLVIASILASGSFAHAFGDAGCGLGSMIFKDNKKGFQILAATTNGIGGQIFAITTGTSDCTSDGFVMNDKKIEYFAEVNQEDLTRQMAQGRGEKLNTLAALYGCNGANQTQFAQMTQSNYGKIVTSAKISANEMVQNISREMQNSNISCQAM
jgi:hypothetical protein